jgi:hypothetical protein
VKRIFMYLIRTTNVLKNAIAMEFAEIKDVNVIKDILVRPNIIILENDCIMKMICRADCSGNGICKSDGNCGCFPGFKGILNKLLS